MGSCYKKALIREEIRESLHGWRKRVKEKAKRESLHPSSTSTKLENALKFGSRDKDESGIESIVYSLSQSPQNVTERCRSLPREISITCQTENTGEDSIHEDVQQEEDLGSHSSVYSCTAENSALPFEANVMDGDDTNEDSTDKHLLGSGSSNNGLAFELGFLDDDNIDEQHLLDPSKIP
ncbi:MLO-like protein 4 [Cryptomeria japonica]|uniref:MLO-like protein 4 n=1 Tax=Cryptomeria japonica TaxID=3369 RepID=UPI0025AC1393|nr:MLO-like protein 4 [Cryptomeria japonica]